MPYAGGGKFPYWMTITYGGVATPGAQTEQIPTVVDGVTTYSLVTTSQFQTSSHTVSLSLTFYNAAGSVIGSPVTASGTVGTTQTSLSTTATVAPTNTSYCIGVISHAQTVDILQVFQAQVQTAANTTQPSIVNVNYTFIYGTDPWSSLNSSLLGWEFDPLTAADGDFDSLVIDNLVELMGGQPGVQSTFGELVDPATGRGVIFRIPFTGGNVGIGSGATGPYDLSAPQPTTDAVQSMLLDGERPFGSRSSNRTLTLPIIIFAPSLNTLAAARETLLRTVDQQTWKLTWKPASSGLPMEFDCFRASPSVITYGFANNAEAQNSPYPSGWAKSLVTLTFSALPYTHSGQDGTQSLAFLNGTLGGGTYVPGVQVDAFSSVSGTGWSLNTAYAFGGSQSARYQAPVPMKMPWAAATYTKSGLNLNLTGMKVLTLWFGQSYDTQWPTENSFVSNVTLTWTLTDTNGHHISFSGKQNKCAWGANPNKPAWTRVNAFITQGLKKSVFDYTKVTGYTVRITNWAGSGTTGYVRMHAWMSQISATASTSLWIQTPHGLVYSVFGRNEMARSPINTEVQLPALNPLTHEFTKSNSWTVPRGVTSTFAEAFGGGGGGGSVANASGGIGAAGGGGAEYAAEPVVSVIPGTLVPFTIGAGGTGGQVVAQENVFARSGPNTWTCPTGVSVISCFLWGGGAAGGAGAGGGGGGTYTEGTVNVTAGTTYTFTVGAGGKPNTGKLSKDQAARHGGDTVVRGDTGALHAQGGASPVTGGTNGGTGGPRFTVPETGTTITQSLSGGNGGNSPGGAGGGGGGSGSNLGNGLRGGDSPKGSNNYASGGPGAVIIGGSNGGAGGKGADVNGTPAPGVTPGGGGGGGYTRSTNYNGAGGGQGKIVIKYQENLGNPINGTSTVFGAAGLTNKVVTAHGGASPAINSSTGAAGGTGSSNTVHFNGGKGALSGNNSDYLMRANDSGGPFTKLQQNNATAASVTTTGSASALTTGLVLVAVESSVALDAQAVVTDSAGNTYDWVAKADIPSGTVDLNVYAAKIGAPITTSTTWTASNNSVSATLTVSVMGSPYYSDIDFATLLTNSGTSTAPGVPAIANADIGIHKGYLVVAANNSTTVISSGPVGPASFAGTTQAGSETSLGSADVFWMLKEIPGSGSSAAGYVATYGSSVPWAAISIPLVPQDAAEPTFLKVGFSNTTATTSTVALTNAFPIPAGRGYMLLLVHVASATGTIGITDTPGNTWASIGTNVTIGTSIFRVYVAKATNAYATTGSVTLTDTTSQAHESTLYYVHETSGPDTALTKTANGSSAAPAITTNAGNSSGDVQMVIFANNNSVDTTATPAGWVNWGNNTSGTMQSHLYAKRMAGKATATVTSAYGVSQTWGAIAFGFLNNVLSGSGGAAGGPLGTGQDGSDDGGSGWSGGGKGANGLTGSVGNGVDAAVPGGGGSGAASTDTSDFQSGTGGAGLLRLTWQPPLTTFNDFILHRPGEAAKKTLCPIITIPPNDPPDNREYAVPSLIPGRNAEFWGTYTIMVVANSWNPATTGSSRRISVTINQYEYTNGPAASVQATRVVTPATDIVNGYVTMGEVTLPVKDYDVSNDQVYYTVSIHDTDQGDSFQDILTLDTSGQTVLVNIAPGTAADGEYSSFFVNEPSLDRAMGQVLGSGHGRDTSVSCLDMALLTGGPLYIEAGENLLLAYSTSGAPDLGITYSPRWYTDRIS